MLGDQPALADRSHWVFVCNAEDMAPLQGEDATVTVVHSRTSDPKSICKDADILIAAIGKPEMVKGDWIKPGATVIDVGTNPVEVISYP